MRPGSNNNVFNWSLAAYLGDHCRKNYRWTFSQSLCLLLHCVFKRCSLAPEGLSYEYWWTVFVCFRSHKSASANQKAGKNSTSANVPSQWSSMPSDKQYKRVPLTSTSSEYKEMETLFKKTINNSVGIKSIERVQNQFMWEKYQRYFILTNYTVTPCLAWYYAMIQFEIGPALPFFYQHQKWRDILGRENVFPMQTLKFFIEKFHDVAKQYQTVDTSHQIKKCLATACISYKF